MWCCRQVFEGIPCNVNNNVTERTEGEKEILSTVRVRNLSYIGHIMSDAKYEVPKSIIRGKIDGWRGRGPLRVTWI